MLKFFPLLLLVLVAPTANGATVTISCGSVGLELRLCQEGAHRWAEQTGNQVKVVSTPNSTTERLALYQQLLAAHSPDIDVFQIDVIWPGILHRHLIDLRPYLSLPEIKAHFQTIITNNTVAGHLVALPWFMDAGLLYYRKDLLARYDVPVPKTWSELTRTAALIQKQERASGRKSLWGFVWQGRAYEGLTCNALEWIYSEDGGTLIDDEGKVTMASVSAARAVDRAAQWVGTITPRGVLNYAEEQARGAFQSGDAVFMRNWPYAWALVNGADSAVRGKVGVTALPRGSDGPHPATLGGWQLAVSRYSQARGAAVSLVRYLTSAAEQKRRALAAGYNPTRPALYADKEILASSPLFRQLLPIFQHAVARPSRIAGRNYNIVSADFWNAVHATLAGRGDALANLKRAQRRIERRLRR